MKQKDIKINLNEYKLKVVKSPKRDESFLMKTAYFIGYSAYYVHEFLVSIWFKIIVVLAAIYGLMRLTRISIEIVRAGEVLLIIK